MFKANFVNSFLLIFARHIFVICSFALFVCSLTCATEIKSEAGGEKYKMSLDNYFAIERRTWSASAINPNNSLLKISDYGINADLRLELKAVFDKLKFVLRPRFLASSEIWTDGQPPTQRNVTAGKFNITDAYVDFRASDVSQINVGLEVYQWGPAEFFNPSNPLFHLSTNSRSSFFKEKGLVLTRFMYDLYPQLNIQIILNPTSNNESPWQTETEFQPSGFLKSELGSQDGSSYVGAIAGSQPDGRRFLGEYGAFGFSNGLSLYLDARHCIGSRRFAPQTLSNGTLLNLQSTAEQISSLGIIGVRWEGRVDARIEYFKNTEGLSNDEFRAAIDSVQNFSPYVVTNLSRFIKPGLEMLGQQYLYSSIRIPDLGSQKNVSLSFRFIESLQDQSAMIQVSSEKPLNDGTVGLIEGSCTLGGDNLELTLSDRTAIFAGLRWVL